MSREDGAREGGFGVEPGVEVVELGVTEAVDAVHVSGPVQGYQEN